MKPSKIRDRIIAYNIRRLRKLHGGLTAQELSYRIQAHKNTVSKVERGIRRVTLSEAMDIATILGCPLTEFFEDPPPRDEDSTENPPKKGSDSPDKDE